MKKLFALIIIALLALGVAACTDPENARRTLENQGYTNVSITGYRPFMGSESDIFVTGFTASSPNGRVVSGAVCSGFFKGSTIRFD